MSNNRRKLNKAEELTLLNETDSSCPMCGKNFMYKKGSRTFTKYEIAHIFPLNLKEIEKPIFLNAEKITDDPNSIENLILLCTGCHTEFDNPRTIEEYDKMVILKKQLLSKTELTSLRNESDLNISIKKVLTKLNTLTKCPSIDPSFEPKTIEEKVKDNISYLTKSKIIMNVSLYYKTVEKYIKILDISESTTSELLASQIKILYLKLKKNKKDYETIYKEIVDWVYDKTDSISYPASEIVVSYYIQSCEVF